MFSFLQILKMKEETLAYLQISPGVLAFRIDRPALMCLYKHNKLSSVYIHKCLYSTDYSDQLALQRKPTPADTANISGTRKMDNTSVMSPSCQSTLHVCLFNGLICMMQEACCAYGGDKPPRVPPAVRHAVCLMPRAQHTSKYGGKGGFFRS